MPKHKSRKNYRYASRLKISFIPEVILFDLDGTLRHTEPSPTKTLIDQAVELGAQDGSKARRRIYQWTHYYWAQSPEWLKDKDNFPEDHDFWLNYTLRSLDVFGCKKEKARKLAPQLQLFMAENYKSQNAIPPDVPVTLELLKAGGFRLGLLSNRSEPCHTELEEWGLASFFEMTMVAGEISAWKPDPGLLLQAMEKMGVQPENAIYIGDNFYADVIASRRAGVQPILVDPDDVFPDVDCPKISEIGELKQLMEYIA